MTTEMEISAISKTKDKEKKILRTIIAWRSPELNKPVYSFKRTILLRKCSFFNSVNKI